MSRFLIKALDRYFLVTDVRASLNRGHYGLLVKERNGSHVIEWKECPVGYKYVDFIELKKARKMFYSQCHKVKHYDNRLDHLHMSKSLRRLIDEEKKVCWLK